MNRTYKSFHVKNRFLGYYFEKIKKENINTVILLDMHIHMDDLNEKTGEDIKEFISILKQSINIVSKSVFSLYA
jgi:uncharacterized protein YegL